MQQNKVHFGICFLCKWRPESQALWSLQADSVNVRHDPVGHALAVLLPGQAVLPPAAALVTGLAVHKQDGEVNDVEIRQNVIKACGGNRTQVRAWEYLTTNLTFLHFLPPWGK